MMTKENKFYRDGYIDGLRYALNHKKNDITNTIIYMEETGDNVPDIVHDFEVWYDDQDKNTQNIVEELPENLDVLPEFCKKWTVSELWSAIRDYIGV